MLNLRLARITMINKNVLGMPTPLVDTPQLRMDLVSKRGPRTLQAIALPISTRRKGRLIWLVVLKRTMSIFIKKVTNVTHHDKCHNHFVFPVCHDDVFSSHAMFATSSSYAHGRKWPRRNHVVSHVPRKVSTGPTAIYHTCDASFVLSCKNAKVVARKLGSKCNRDITCIWVPKYVVTNLVGPTRVRYLKPKLNYLAGLCIRGLKLDIDSGYTNHMTGEKKMFTSDVKNRDSQDTIIFGDRNQGKVKGLGQDSHHNRAFDL
jgi:hypothetical protein